jgi:thiamine-monophosphate kinase
MAPNLSETGEEEILRCIRRMIPESPEIPVGIGDDAACLAFDRKSYLLFTVDAVVDGVDFHLAKISPEAVGRKTLAQNLSDIAAMGGLPLYAVVSLGLPRRFPLRFVERFYRGMMPLAREWGVAIVGGDLSRSRVFFASLALLGRVERKNLVRRSGARDGDLLFVTGALGGSILGRHFSFRPRLREARQLVTRHEIHAMIDVSDGLIEDLARLCEASGKGACVYLNRVPVSSDARRLARMKHGDALRSALTDGEDFELLFACSKREGRKILRRGIGRTRVTSIGEITASRKMVFLKNDKDGKECKIPWRGFRHF